MATIKSFTDLPQSKKLAEILPLKSADMCYVIDYAESNKYGTDHFKLEVDIYGFKVQTRDNIPCWSLTALLGVIRETIGYNLYGVNNVRMSCDLGDKPWELETEVYDNEIDACVDMIIKLHELNLL